MRRVQIVLATEQRHLFIQPGGVKRTEVVRQAELRLIDIRLQQVKYAAD